MFRQASSFSARTQPRTGLDMAKTLHGSAIDLRRTRESGTINTMRDVSAAGKAASCRPQRGQDLQYHHSRYQRTLTYSAKWTLCYLRFSNVTQNRIRQIPDIGDTPRSQGP